MFRVQRTICLLGLAAVVGCSETPPARLNAPPQGAAERQSSIAANYAYMNDQGMMADCSIADMHFVPHSAELNGTGQARLSRYAELLADHGGTITYDTYDPEAPLTKARLESAKRFLDEAMGRPSPPKLEVAIGLPGGRGMDANEAQTRRKQMLSQSPKTSGSARGFFGTGGG